MPDPNARRDKALENIARGLDQINDTLKKIERNTRRDRVTFTNHPYLEETGGDEKQSAGSDVAGPYGTETSQPYT